MKQPSAEARLLAQEELTTILHAQIKQLSLDMQANFRDLKQDIKQLDDGIKASYTSIGDTFIATWDDIKATLATKEDVSRLEMAMATKQDVSRLEMAMATKQDVSRLEMAMATKQDVNTIETRLDRVESDITSIKATQEQILQLLQQKPGK